MVLGIYDSTLVLCHIWCFKAKNRLKSLYLVVNINNVKILISLKIEKIYTSTGCPHAREKQAELAKLPPASPHVGPLARTYVHTTPQFYVSPACTPASGQLSGVPACTRDLPSFSSSRAHGRAVSPGQRAGVPASIGRRVHA